jgi:enolase
VDHAGYASKLLKSLSAVEQELADASPDKLLELAATGRIAELNANARHTVQLAAAHAMTAIALHLQERDNVAERR